MSAPTHTGSLGMVVFHRLCEAGNALDALRETLCPGSDAWVALCELVHGVDALIDTLVHSDPLEEDLCRGDVPHG